VALAVDAISGVIDLSPHETVSPQAIVPGMEHVAGVAKLPDGMLFIHDLARFLSLDEEGALEAALAGETGETGQP
jgi:purine-binding chemotaxis protein CheW